MARWIRRRQRRRPVDGVMGPKTTEALKAYQKSENLPTTGTMDGDTRAKLGVKVSTEGR
jgi:peptidoglycan hydrolase-like protein with peptidoglycan-binding domain